MFIGLRNLGINRLGSDASTPIVSNLSFVGFASGTNSVVLPAHQAGDLLLAFCFDVAGPNPGLLAGWTPIAVRATTTGVQAGSRTQYFVAIDDATANPTFTNTTDCCVVVLRGAKVGTPIGGIVATADIVAGAQPIKYTHTNITMSQVNGTSWIVLFGGNIPTDGDMSVTPTNTTLRGTSTGTGEIAAFDTNGGVSAWNAPVSVVVGGTQSLGWVSYSIEIQSA